MKKTPFDESCNVGNLKIRSTFTGLIIKYKEMVFMMLIFFENNKKDFTTTKIYLENQIRN